MAQQWQGFSGSRVCSNVGEGGMGAVMRPGAIAYFNGEYVPIEEANVSIMTHALNYGTGLFEGIRGYYNDDEKNVLIFRLK